MTKYLIALLMCFFSLTSNAQVTVKSSAENFLKRDIFGEMKLSPTGEYLAATVALEDRTDLIILRVSDMKKTGYARVENKHLIAGFNWVNPTRIIFSMAVRSNAGASPEALEGLYGVNADGSGQGRPIVGNGADQFESSGTLIKKIQSRRGCLDVGPT